MKKKVENKKAKKTSGKKLNISGVSSSLPSYKELCDMFENIYIDEDNDGQEMINYSVETDLKIIALIKKYRQ